MNDLARIAEQAAAWHAAALGVDMDWTGFTAWLAEDDRHRIAYDQVALADDLVAARPDLLRGGAASAVDPVVVAPGFGSKRRWPLWLGSGLAASLAALMIAGQVIPPEAERFSTAGQSRTIALGDGSQVVLAPRSSLSVGGRDGTQLALAGAAYFDIRHRPDRTLAVTAGALTVTDIGTRFEISRHGDRVQVEVAEGEVATHSQALAKVERLVAGKRLVLDPALGRATLSTIAPDQVGDWREGRLNYDSERLDLVAADLARYAGIRVEVSQGVGTRRFSGSLLIGDGENAIRDLAQLMQLRLRRDGAVWRLEPSG